MTSAAFSKMQRMIDSHFRRQDALERMLKMDKDNFAFHIGAHIVSMENGQLTINGCDYESDDDPLTYDLARRVAFEAGCFDDDSEVPAVTWSAG